MQKRLANNKQQQSGDHQRKNSKMTEATSETNAAVSGLPRRAPLF